jgi:signal transduction histidine kinase/CheY-like chemotaxis protein
MDIFERTLRGENHGSREYTLMRKDGKRIPCLIYASPIVRSGVTVGLRGIIIDNRDQKRLEQEILKAQKLESLGILAGGIAHDFNNILTSILGNLSLARLYLDRGDNGVDRVRDRVSDAETASRRAKDLTQQLLTFSKGGKPVKRLIASAEVIREAAGFTSIGSGVRCEFDLAEDLWDVEADAGQLTQVLNNLVINASQAMGRGGLVRIIADNIPEARSKTFSLGAGNHIRICVQDRGTGIPEEYLSRVFDPYFTTKEGGSGLGLATAYSIVHNHGGTITVDSRPGEGTTVCIFLPAEGTCSTRKVDVEIEPVCGQGKILVMDDEEGVRLVVSEMLDVLGYRCVTTGDGNEAVRLYREAMSGGDPFSAVLMDLTVPGGMGGKEAVMHLLDADPGVRVIASSGYSNDPVMSNHGAYGFKGVIGKPYRVKELAEVVRRILQTSERTEH